MNDERKEVAKLWCSFSPDPDRPMVMIYGNPAGLRSLAQELIEKADYQQCEGGSPDSVEHWHLWPGHAGLIESSVEVMISRMDHRETGATNECEGDLKFSREQLDKTLRELE